MSRDVSGASIASGAILDGRHRQVQPTIEIQKLQGFIGNSWALRVAQLVRRGLVWSGSAKRRVRAIRLEPRKGESGHALCHSGLEKIFGGISGKEARAIYQTYSVHSLNFHHVGGLNIRTFLSPLSANCSIFAALTSLCPSAGTPLSTAMASS